jgi:heat shock protein HslJ
MKAMTSFLVALSLLGCVRPDQNPALSDLKNGTYRGVYPEAVTLVQGRYEGPAFTEGGASRPTVTFLEDALAYGDVTGDGRADAVVLLAEDSGGSGTFVYLALVAGAAGGPVEGDATLLGDRVQVASLMVEDNRVAVGMVQHGPGDPACCPTQEVIKTFESRDGRLVEVSTEVVQEGGGAPGLVGPIWEWVETLMSNDDRFEPEGSGDYTLEFKTDATVAVQADCNRVAGGYNLDGNRLTIQLGPSTMAACPEGSLGERFVAGLEAANGILFDEGDLILTLMYDSGTMRFSPQRDGLPGTSWTVIGYNNGRGGVVSTLIGTELSVAFGPDGTLTGFAGCNRFTAGYEVDGARITIGPTASTRMACDLPEGVMDQEVEYQTALGTAATFQITGARMEMRTSEGSIAATFERER